MILSTGEFEILQIRYEISFLTKNACHAPHRKLYNAGECF